MNHFHCKRSFYLIRYRYLPFEWIKNHGWISQIIVYIESPICVQANWLLLTKNYHV